MSVPICATAPEGSVVTAKPEMAQAAAKVINMPIDMVPYTLFIWVRSPSSIAAARDPAADRIVFTSAMNILQIIDVLQSRFSDLGIGSNIGTHVFVFKSFRIQF